MYELLGKGVIALAIGVCFVAALAEYSDKVRYE